MAARMVARMEGSLSDYWVCMLVLNAKVSLTSSSIFAVPFLTRGRLSVIDIAHNSYPWRKVSGELASKP